MKIFYNDHQICIMYVLRRWDHKTRKWYYHSSPQSSTVHNGYTGGLLVGLMVILLWLYSFYRLWMVWAYTLNFDGVGSNSYIISLDTLILMVTFGTQINSNKNLMKVGKIPLRLSRLKIIMHNPSHYLLHEKHATTRLRPLNI